MLFIWKLCEQNISAYQFKNIIISVGGMMSKKSERL